MTNKQAKQQGHLIFEYRTDPLHTTGLRKTNKRCITRLLRERRRFMVVYGDGE